MKKIILTTVILLSMFFVSQAEEPDLKPILISPGDSGRSTVIEQSFPTFSWSGVKWAAKYRVAVFETVTTDVLAFEEMKTLTNPVISKAIRGPALSWTPSKDERLSTGTMYVWYVQAQDFYGQGTWSTGKVFKVEAKAILPGITNRFRASMKENGVSEEIITDVLADMRSEVNGVTVQGSASKSSGNQTPIGIQGHEGTSNTTFGQFAGAAMTTGLANAFMGWSAGRYNSAGYNNTFLGYQAGLNNTSGDNNTFLGRDAGASNLTGYFNTFIGGGTGYTNSTGYDNTFLGTNSGAANTTGHKNTLIGNETGYSNITGSTNTFIGHQTGYSNTTGSSNTFIGRGSGYSNNGSFNTLLGVIAGYNNTTGTGNIFLGYSAGVNESGNNKLYIDNSGTATPLIYGEFDNDIVAVNGKLGVGTQSPGADIEIKKSGLSTLKITNVGGAIFKLTAGLNNVQIGATTNHGIKYLAGGSWKMQLNANGNLYMRDGGSYNGTWNNASSRELKENIEPIRINEAINTLANLEPVKYNYKKDKDELHAGFIAEDVPELVATNGRKNISTMDIVAVLTMVVKEQQKAIAELNRKLAQQEKK